MVKTTMAVKRGCDVLGISFQDTIMAIHNYGDRNQDCHHDIEINITKVAGQA
jgi:hypothetical protein